MLGPQPQASDSDQWAATLERAIDALVSIRFIIPRNFDTWRVGSFTAVIISVGNFLRLVDRVAIDHKENVARQEKVVGWTLGEYLLRCEKSVKMWRFDPELCFELQGESETSAFVVLFLSALVMNKYPRK